MTEAILVIAILVAAGSLIGVFVQQNSLKSTKSALKSLETKLMESEGALESKEQNIGELQLAQSNLSGKMDELRSQNTALKAETDRKSDLLLVKERELTESKLEKTQLRIESTRLQKHPEYHQRNGLTHEYGHGAVHGTPQLYAL